MDLTGKLYAMSTRIDAVGGKAQRAEAERRRLCKMLSSSLDLPLVEWLEVPLGSLQSAASGTHGIHSFTVEAPLPRDFPVLYTKFDFSEGEAQQMATQMAAFIAAAAAVVAATGG